MTKRRVPVDFEESELLIQLLKRHELAEGETDRTRHLVRSFRAARDMLATGQPDDTDAVASEIFAAGSGEGGRPSYREFKRDGVLYTKFPDGKVYGDGPLATARL